MTAFLRDGRSAVLAANDVSRGSQACITTHYGHRQPAAPSRLHGKSGGPSFSRPCSSSRTGFERKSALVAECAKDPTSRRTVHGFSCRSGSAQRSLAAVPIFKRDPKSSNDCRAIGSFSHLLGARGAAAAAAAASGVHELRGLRRWLGGLQRCAAIQAAPSAATGALVQACATA